MYVWDTLDTRVALKLIRGSLFVKYVDIIRFNDPCWLSLSLLPFLPFLVSWLMPRHWLLPRRLPFIFLNQRHSLPPRTYSFMKTRRTKEDNELLHQRNQPLAGTAGRHYRFGDDPDVSMRARASCTHGYVRIISLYAFKNISMWRSPTKEETIASKIILSCLCQARMYLCIWKDLCAMHRASSANSIVPYGTRSSFTRESRSGGLWWRNHRSQCPPVTSLHRMYRRRYRI